MINRYNSLKQSIIGSIRKIVVLAAIAVFAWSCEAVKGEPAEFPVKEKTVLVYMVGNNNLSSVAEANLAGIKQGFIPEQDKGNIITYYHIANQAPLLLNIIKDETGQIVADTVYRFPARNSATPEALKSAMQVTKTMFPADEFGIILWSHGTGWLPVGYYENNPRSSSSANGTPMVRNSKQNLTAEASGSDIFTAYANGIDPYAHLVKMATGSGKTRSFGSEEGKEINITDLVKAFPSKVSYVIFDACLMGGIETAYQLKDSTDYVLFSPAEVLADGFPYSKIMQHIFSSPTNLEGVAREYYNHYNSQSGDYRSATVSLVKTSELESVAAAAKEVFDTNREKIATLNMNGIQRYFRSNKHWFYDIQDFINKLGTESQAATFKQALDKAVIYKASTPYFLDIYISRYSGISTYIPIPANEELDSFYKNLDWNKASGMIQ